MDSEKNSADSSSDVVTVEEELDSNEDGPEVMRKMNEEL